MTVIEAAQDLATYFAPEEIGAPVSTVYPERNETILHAINGALQECFAARTPWSLSEDRGEALYAPTAVVIEVEAGSKFAVVVSGWGEWMAGCSIVIAGHDCDNLLQYCDGSTVTLKYPYAGTSGQQAATVYCDAIQLPEDVLSLTGRVFVDLREIKPEGELDDIQETDDYGSERDFGIEGTRIRQRVRAGQPASYRFETARNRFTIRIFPAAESGGIIDYTANLRPDRVSTTTSAETLPIPFDFVESIFLPIARQRLTSAPYFRPPPAGISEINRAYQEARNLLASLDPDRPKTIAIDYRF